MLLIPQRSNLESRKDVILERAVTFRNSGHTWTGIPIIASNTDTTGTIEMALALQEYKMLTCLHKFYKPGDIPKTLDKNYYMVSTGTGDKDLKNLDEIVAAHDPLFICIDVANGYCQKFIDVIKSIRKKYPKKVLVGGNVVTPEMAQALVLEAGLDVVKVGIGSGSICTTRLQAGVGYPQWSAVVECASAAHVIGAHIISDGGVQNVGDISKALGAGADFIMCGSMFAGHDESGGEIVEISGTKWKIYYGMASATAMHKYHGGVAEYRSSEGKTVRVPYRGPVKNTVNNILGGIRSAMTYIGAKSLEQIPQCASFVRVNAVANAIYNGYEV